VTPRAVILLALAPALASGCRAVGTRVETAPSAVPLPAQERSARLFGLGQLGLDEGFRRSPEITAEVLAATADPDPAIAVLAYEALGKLADRSTSGQIVAGTHHDSSAVRAEAVTALFRLRFVPLWRKETEAAPELPPEAVAALSEAMRDPASEVRRAAAHACSRYGEPEAVLDLSALLADGDDWTRLFAARALGRSKDVTAAEVLRRATRDASPAVRVEAVTALAALDQFEGLLPLAYDGTFVVRAALAQALGTAHDAESTEILWKLENDRSMSVRTAAIVSLGRRLGPAYGERILELFTESDWRLRVAAAHAAAFAGAAAAGWLVTALGDADGRVQVAALSSLGELKQGREAILGALDSPDLALRGTAVELAAALDPPPPLERLIEAYERSAGADWSETREALVEAVAKRDGAVPFLERVARQDPVAAVRGHARRALSARGVSVPEEQPRAPESVPPSAEPERGDDPLVTLETSKGQIRIRLFPHDAPEHVRRFLARVREGFYDGLIWHRVVPNFVIQGGDPRGDGWGTGGPPVRDEISRRRFERGTVGMPKSGKDTGGCQLFITHLPTPHLDGNYTVFGQVIFGLDVVDKIEVGDRIETARTQQ
jgi:cyclophilin family peptidyl-prolyl cis-trans isomerase/HEAT repeat protein